MKLFLKMACVLLCGIVVGYVLLLGAFLLPVEPIRQNVLASVPALNGEWDEEASYEQLVPGYLSTQLDNSTDAAMLMHAMHESDLPVTVRAAECFCYISDGNAFSTLLGYQEQAKTNKLASAPVARYWHGYLVLLKPLLLAASYLDIRVLLMAVQGGMLALTLVGLCKRRLEKLVGPFLISLLFLSPHITGFSLQYSTSLCVFLLAVLLLLYLPPRFFEGRRTAFFFLLTGMLTCYADYLTYPIVAFGMTFVVCMFLFPKKNAKEEWKRFVLLGFCWCMGYFGMWAGKWGIASLFGNEEWFWPNLLVTITTRSSDQSAGVQLQYADVLRAVCGVFWKRAYLALGAAALGVWLIRLLRNGLRTEATAWGERCVLLAVTALPFVWFFFTQNHSYNHAFFTSRGLSVSAFAFSAFLNSFIRPETRANRRASESDAPNPDFSH